EGDLQDVPDVERIAADKIAAQLLDLCGDGTVAVILAVGFAPADHAGIGRNAHEHEILPPARIDRKTFDADDLHCVLRCQAHELIWPIAFDRHPTAGSRLRVVVPQRLVLDAAVVPEGDRMRLPAEPALELLTGTKLAEKVEDGTAFVSRQLVDVGGEVAI